MTKQIKMYLTAINCARKYDKILRFLLSEPYSKGITYTDLQSFSLLHCSLYFAIKLLLATSKAVNFRQHGIGRMPGL